MALGFAFFLMIMYKQIKSEIIPKTIAQSLAVYLFHIKYFLNFNFIKHTQ